MRLTIAGDKDSSPVVAFRFEQDGNEVNVYGNDTFIGWFKLNQDGKIQFCTSFITESERRTFAVDDNHELLATGF